MPANYTLLEKITVGAAGASSVSFSGIPQTGYTDLVVKVSGRASNPYMDINFNNNATGFTSKYLYGTGSAAGSGSQAKFLGVTSSTSNTANTFGNMEFYIPNYTSANYKSYSADSAQETNATAAEMHLVAGLWSNTAAITSIQIIPASSGTFSQYTTFYLYGVAKLGTTPAIVPYATGGDTIMTDGTYWYHTFVSSGTFTPQKALSVDYLVVAGGGGGVRLGGGGTGGGGAGGLRCTVTATGGGGSLESKLSLASGTGYTVTIGAGGAANSTGTSTTGNSGSNSVFSTITSSGGGGGANSATYSGVTGGSGGGGGAGGTSQSAGGSGTANQGYAGGAGLANTGTYGLGGGGGGAGAVGVNATQSPDKGGNGGAGVTTSISGSSVTYAGGGGGGVEIGTAGTGGTGGGGNGGAVTAAGTDGTANTGGGAGSVYNNATARAGGSGIVIVRYAV
jgi:hypothetical protein